MRAPDFWLIDDDVNAALAFASSLPSSSRKMSLTAIITDR